MICSMTGFGRGLYSIDGKEYLVEIKTVNHRYLDTSVRLPRAYSYLEAKIREMITSKLSRGKVDVNVWIEDYGTDGRTVMLDEGLADLYVESLKSIKNRYSLDDNITLSLITRFPDILKVKKDEEDEKKIVDQLKEAMNSAIEALIQMRRNEGEQLKADILQKISNLENMLSKIEEIAPNVVVEYRNKLNNRIKEIISDNKPDEGRLELEIALFADRCSIEEEITRLKSHFKQVRQTLDMEQGIGRKLDFIVQEMNREINTIGSKANSVDITKVVVDAKSEMEKIREQIQNIE